MSDYDVLVVGSGFGGGVTALRLAEKGYRVGVLEAGRRFADHEFAETSWHLRDYLWAPWAHCFGIFRVNPLRDVLVLSGAGVGGGSLVYANTLYRPPRSFYDDPQWAGITDWADELAPHYDQAERMLGATSYPRTSPADEVMRAVADEMGVGHTYRPAEVGVFFGAGGGGIGPRRGGARPLLRWRRTGPARVPALRGVHDGLPPQRQEHGGQELPAPRRGRGRAGAPDDHGPDRPPR